MEIDWEQRRYEIAKEMLAAFHSSPCFNVFGTDRWERAKTAVKCADILIEELKNDTHK